MDYTNGHMRRYQKNQFDFDGAGSIVLKGPKGKRGFLYDYGVYDVTETFAGTTAPSMSVGDGSTVDKFGKALSLTATTATGGQSLLTDKVPGTAAFVALLAQKEIPADTVVTVTMNAGITGPAGIANVFVDIIWEF